MYRIFLGFIGALAVGEDSFDDIDFDNMMMDDDLDSTYSSGPSQEVLETNAKRDFTEFDANGDGELDPLEIRTRFKGYLNEKDLYIFYDTADKDFTGTVCWDEYWKYVNTIQEGGSTAV